MKHCKALLLSALLAFPAAPLMAGSFNTDNRVQTLVYDENEVFNIATLYGYQSSIEFSKNEVIQTISVGDRTAWQIIPAGRRLFIRPREYGTQTNMTIITNKRTYLFDLHATRATDKAQPQIAYIARFFYPDEQPSAPVAPEVSSADLMQSIFIEPAGANYRYTYTGDDRLAPSKIFDDGRTTYMKLPPQAMPMVSLATPDGGEKPVVGRRQGEYLMLPVVGAKFILRYDEKSAICIYNEALKPSAAF